MARFWLDAETVDAVVFFMFSSWVAGAVLPVLVFAVAVTGEVEDVEEGDKGD